MNNNLEEKNEVSMTIVASVHMKTFVRDNIDIDRYRLYGLTLRISEIN